jgi:acetyl-CoA acetyltransferase
MINDGAAAMIVSSLDQARNLRQRPIRVLGSAGGHSGYFTGFIANGDRRGGHSLTSTLAAKAAQAALAEAGCVPDEMDLMTTSDSFAIQPILMLEDYGFCAKGEGGPFVGDGTPISIGGRLPVNPHGGSLSCTHAPTNFLNYIEAVWQLRGQAGERQIPDARLALAASGAGIVSTHYVSVLAAD